MTTPTTSDPGAGSPVGAGRRTAPTPGAAPRPSESRGWWVLLVLGVLTVFYGLLVMSLRPAAVATLALLAGLAFVVAGAAQFLLAGALEGGWRYVAVAGGVLGIVAGVAAVAWPAVTLTVLAILTAWSFVVNGLTRLVATLVGSKRGLWWLGLLLGAAELALGLWAIGSPGREILLLVNLIGIFLVVAGVDAVVGAFAVRSAGAEVTRP